MIGTRWANAGVGRPNPIPVGDVNTAYTQGDEEMTVTLASKALQVGGRGIYHARIVLEKGTPEEIADYARARPAPWMARYRAERGCERR